MYAHIDGIVSYKAADTLVIDCGGVGYQMLVSAGTLSNAPAVGERMKCFTILNVREDALELFGFYSLEEKRMFEKLRGVSGVGPRTAMQVLSSISVRDLSIALVTGDATALTRVPGIGKKTAQRLVLELRDKVDNAELTGQAAALPQYRQNDAVGEAIEALMALGYQNAEAARAVARVADQADKTDALVLLALKGMNG